MASLFDTTHNFSLYTIPTAWSIPFLLHAYAATRSKVFDVRSSRTYPLLLEKDQTIDSATKARIFRYEGALANGFENLDLFAAAVVAGSFAGFPAKTLNTLSGGYLISRIVYNFIYINNNSKTMAHTRTVVFLVGIGHIFTLLIKSGNFLRERAANLL